MRINRSKGFIILGILMLCGAVVIEGMNLYQDYKRKAEAEKIVFAMEAQMSNDQNDLETGITIDSEMYCGILEIPEIDVVLPVSREYSYEQMALSLCRYHGELSDKNMIICGHNNKSFLGRLKEVFEGDMVYFIDSSGTEYSFVVNEVQMIGEYDITELTAGGTDWDMSVFTCNYSGYQRYVLRCKLNNADDSTQRGST